MNLLFCCYPDLLSGYNESDTVHGFWLILAHSLTLYPRRSRVKVFSGKGFRLNQQALRKERRYCRDCCRSPDWRQHKILERAQRALGIYLSRRGWPRRPGWFSNPCRGRRWRINCPGWHWSFARSTRSTRSHIYLQTSWHGEGWQILPIVLQRRRESKTSAHSRGQHG